MFAWCKQDEEAKPGYQDLWEKIVVQRMTPGYTSGWSFLEAETTKAEPGKEAATVAISGASDPWWVLNSNSKWKKSLKSDIARQC